MYNGEENYPLAKGEKMIDKKGAYDLNNYKNSVMQIGNKKLKTKFKKLVQFETTEFEPNNNELKKQFGTKRKIIELFKNYSIERECDLVDMIFRLQKILENFEEAIKSKTNG